MALAPLGKAIDVVGTANGQLWIFALNRDGQMIYKYWDGNAWQPSQIDWEPLGGKFASPPSAALRNYTPTTTQLDVVAVTSSGKLAHKYWDGTEWQPSQMNWDYLEALGNPPTISFAHPVAITGLEGPNIVDVVAVGTDANVYHKYLDGGTWQPSGIWEALGGTIRNPPAVAGLDTQQLKFNVMGIGASGSIVHKYWNGVAWQPSQTGWEDLGGNFGEVGAAGMSSDVQFDVFGIPSPFGGLLHKTFVDATGWLPAQNWETLG